MVFKGRKTLRTLRDFIVLMSLPLLFLLTLKDGTQEQSCTQQLTHRDKSHKDTETVKKAKKTVKARR